MPQLSPDFWALNFVTIWTLLFIILAITISLQLPLPPSQSSPQSATTPTAQWLWV